MRVGTHAGRCLNFAVFFGRFEPKLVQVTNVIKTSRCHILWKSCIRFLSCYMQARHLVKPMCAFFRLHLAEAPEMGPQISMRLYVPLAFNEVTCHCGPCFPLVLMSCIHISVWCVCFRLAVVSAVSTCEWKLQTCFYFFVCPAVCYSNVWHCDVLWLTLVTTCTSTLRAHILVFCNILETHIIFVLEDVLTVNRELNFDVLFKVTSDIKGLKNTKFKKQWYLQLDYGST